MKSWDQIYIEIALNIAQQSKANRRKVGAVLVFENQIISYGYNGTAPNMDNACEDEHGETIKTVIHSEVNAIAKCATNGIKTKGATMYVTFSPCINCALLMIQAGISKVIYLDQYSDFTGIDLLKAQGISCEKIFLK